MSSYNLKKSFESIKERANNLINNKLEISIDDKFNFFLNGNDLFCLKLRPYQEEFHHAYYIKGFRKFFEVLPRRAGKEIETWTLLVKEALRQPGPYAIVYPSYTVADRNLWDAGFINEEKIFIKLTEIIDKNLIKSKNSKNYSITLKNRSIIRVLGTKFPDDLRGMELAGVVISEFAFIDPKAYEILLPIINRNKGFMILQTTFDGMNHAYNLYNNIKESPEWFSRVETALTLLDPNGNRYITDEMIDQSRRDGMPEYMIQQEYFNKVTLNESIHYFCMAMENVIQTKRVVERLADNSYPVNFSFDLGYDDFTAITFFQYASKTDIRIIHYYEEHRKDFRHFLEYICSFCVKHNLVRGIFIFPHDAANVDQQTGNSRIEWFQNHNCQSVLVKRPSSKIDAIRLIREYIYRTVFDKIEADRLIKCLSNYRQEEKNGVYKNYPRHDWTSHGVDSYQTMVLGIEEGHIQPNDFYYQQVGVYV